MSRLLLRLVLVTVVSEGISANLDIFSETPVSQNVSEGSTVKFSCATPYGATVNIQWIISASGLTITPSNEGGLERSTVSFMAKAIHNKLTIVCAAGGTVNGSLVYKESPGAVLLVQGLLFPVGGLKSTKMDHCTLNITWTAPYTLQGVPISYYNITITGHSDEAVLGSYTTTGNTTKFRHSVSRLRETLEVVVAAVNDVGTGNSSAIMVQSPSSINIEQFPFNCHDIKRNNSDWTYTFHIEGMSICSLAVDKIVIQKCSDTIMCKNTSGSVSMLSTGVSRVVATFPNVTENRMYSASALVHYNGGVMHHSQSVVISTYDVQNVTVDSVLYGRVCLIVEYVKGLTITHCFAKLTCGTLEYTQVINGTSGCINNVLPHESCNLTVTDGDDDAVHNINTAAPVTITGISVPSYTVAPSTTSTTPTATPTASTGTDDSPTSPPTVLLLVVAGSTGGVLLALVIIIIIVVVGIFYLYKRNRVVSEMKPQPEQRPTTGNWATTEEFHITSWDVIVTLESPTTGNWATTEEVQNTEAATPTRESDFTPSSIQPPADYPPPAKPPNVACDEAATPTQQEYDYAIVGTKRPPDHPHQPPPADTHVVYSDVLFPK